MKQDRLSALIATALLGACTFAHASSTTVTVDARDDLYNAGSANAYEGLNPIAIDVTGLSSVTFAVSTLTGVSMNIGSGNNYSNADGVGSVSGEYNVGSTTLSGINSPVAGFLAGVFLGASTVSKPASLDFASSGTTFTSLSAGLQQTFFIGDGLTGNGTGATQTFYVPAGATTLYLGITDACGYSGGPSCYNDNDGTLTVTTQTLAAVSAVPEPETWALLVSGLLVVGWSALKRRARAATAGLALA